MKALNIDALLNNPPRNRVRRVGIELEGAWKEDPRKAGVAFHHDGSVKGFEDPTGKKVFVTGEVVSAPLIPAFLGEWVTANYPLLVNKTCGLHLHMSFFKDVHYHRLMCPEYQETIITYFRQWARREGFCETHHIWNRLNGDEKYCHNAFWPDAQAMATEHGDQASPNRFWKRGSRYTIVNYCYNIEDRGTFEVRVLPMMDTAEQAVRALYHVIDITNCCLFALKHVVRNERQVFDVSGIDLTSEVVEEDYVSL